MTSTTGSGTNPATPDQSANRWTSFDAISSRSADAVAMASYRKLAEEAVANQQELRDQLAKLTEKVQAVEQLMREVG